MASTVAAPPAAAAPSFRGTAVLLVLAGLIAVLFFAGAAAPYFLNASYQADLYTGRRVPLLIHIVGGTIALFAGPIQLWLGITDRRIGLHRRLGVIYMIGVGVGAVAAYYLAFVRPAAGWIFGAGLAGLATAWIATTGMAYFAVRRTLIEQHKEWMIRSYVVTFAFVIFRIGYVVLQGAQLGAHDGERAALMAWVCWSLPLLATEVVLQGRKIRKVAG